MIINYEEAIKNLEARIVKMPTPASSSTKLSVVP